MQIRVITMRYSEALQGFPEDALKTATFGREVLGHETHFFAHGNVPHLALVLALDEVRSGGSQTRFDRKGAAAAELEAQIPPENFGVYLALKDWRNRKSKMTGRPAYAIARNAQLIELVLKAPKSLAGIREIEGCGESFCKEFGNEVLKLLADVKPAPVKAAEDAAAGTEAAKADKDSKNPDGKEPETPPAKPDSVLKATKQQ